MKKYGALILGIILVAFACFIYYRNNAFFRKAEKTNAYISRIETERSRRNGKIKYHHTAYVTYEVNGVRYENIKLNYYSFDMDEGETITIYYNPDNPRVIKYKKENYILIGVMGLFGGTSIITFIRNRKR